MTADDVLWRRSKLGLHANEESISRLTDWLATKRSETAQLTSIERLERASG
jgi:glycerol-3-phosphate dehydrogenase